MDRPMKRMKRADRCAFGILRLKRGTTGGRQRGLRTVTFQRMEFTDAEVALLDGTLLVSVGSAGSQLVVKESDAPGLYSLLRTVF
jgi:hypothetical protein